MSRHPSKHSGILTKHRSLSLSSLLYLGISCDSCGKNAFPGKRYKCLTCYDFDLCQDCYEGGETGTSQHNTDHPMQVILTKVEAGMSLLHKNTHFVIYFCQSKVLSKPCIRHSAKHVDNFHQTKYLDKIDENICPLKFEAILYLIV